MRGQYLATPYNDSCKHIRTKTNLNLSKNPNRIMQVNQKCNKVNVIECSICFNSISISTVGLSPKCWQSLNKAKGYFYYTCTSCLSKSANDPMDLSSTLETPIIKPLSENEQQSTRIIIHKRRKLVRQNCLKIAPISSKDSSLN